MKKHAPCHRHLDTRSLDTSPPNPMACVSNEDTANGDVLPVGCQPCHPFAWTHCKNGRRKYQQNPKKWEPFCAQQANTSSRAARITSGFASRPVHKPMPIT